MISIIKFTFRTFLGLLLLTVLTASFVYYILETAPGLRFSISMLNKVIPGQVQYTQLTGNLLNHIEAQNFTYNNADTHIAIKSINLSWDLLALPNKITINELRASGINIQIPTNTDSKKSSSSSLRWLSRLDVRHMQMQDIRYNQYQASKFMIDEKSFSLLSNVGDISGSYKLQFSPYLKWEASVMGSHLNPEILNPQMKGDLNLDAQTQGQWHGKDNDFNLQIKKFDGTVSDLPVEGLADITYQNGSLRIADTKLTLAKAVSEVSGTVTDKWNIKWSLAIPSLKAISPGFTGTITTIGSISGDRNDPQIQGNLLADNFNDIEKIQTDFTASVKLNDDDIAKSSVNLNLQNASVDVPKYSINVKPITITSSMSNGGPINFQGTFNLDSKPGQVSGSYDLEKSQLNLKLSGTDLPISKSPEYTITASPDINLSYVDNQFNLSGKIDIPTANINPQDFNDVVTLPSEVQIINGESDDVSETSLPVDMALELQINIGNKVHFSYDKLSTDLGGSVTITQTPHRVPVANGELYAKNGVVNIYGRKLNIDNGRILYTGNALTNPGLDIRASKEIKTIAVSQLNSYSSTQQTNSPQTAPTSVYTGTETMKVGVDVKGTVKKPLITYFSDNNLDQDDIISYLIFGYPRSQVSQVKGANAIALLNSVALNSLSSSDNKLSSIGSIPAKIQSSLNLDEFGFGSMDNYDPKTNTVTSNITTFNIGKQLGDKLFVHYSVGVQDSSMQVLNLRYQLNKHFSIQSESSPLENGADLVYVIER